MALRCAKYQRFMTQVRVLVDNVNLMPGVP